VKDFVTLKLNFKRRSDALGMAVMSVGLLPLSAVESLLLRYWKGTSLNRINMCTCMWITFSTVHVDRDMITMELNQVGTPVEFTRFLLKIQCL
jgi:hypothetical protein